MPVFFIHSSWVDESSLTIHEPLTWHLLKSLRIRQGERIWVGDERRQRYFVQISRVAQPLILAEILEKRLGPTPDTPSLVLAQAILKGDRMNWVIQKATELGVTTIVPLLSTHVVVQLRSDQVNTHRERWKRIAIEAAQQSERWEVPTIERPCPAQDFWARPTTSGLKAILVERQAGMRLSRVEMPSTREAQVTWVVGPEGGWSQEEQEEAEQNGYEAVTLGPYIFRSETAAIASVSVILNRLGRLG